MIITKREPKKIITIKWWEKKLPLIVKSEASGNLAVALTTKDGAFTGVWLQGEFQKESFSCNLFTEYTGAVILQNED